MRTSRSIAQLQVGLAAVFGVMLFLTDWLTLRAGRFEMGAGLWGTERARWDDLHIDLDFYAFGYIAFAVGVISVFMLVRSATAQMKGVTTHRATAKKWMIACVVTMVAFLLRFLVENGVSISWAGIVGPLAAIGALVTLHDR